MIAPQLAPSVSSTLKSLITPRNPSIFRNFAERREIKNLVNNPVVQRIMRHCQENDCVAVASDSWFTQKGIILKEDVRHTLVITGNGIGVLIENATDHNDNRTSCDRIYYGDVSDKLKIRDVKNGQLSADAILKTVAAYEQSSMTHSVDYPLLEAEGSRNKVPKGFLEIRNGYDSKPSRPTIYTMST